MDRFQGEQLPAEDILDDNGHIVVPKKHCTVPQLLSQGLIPANYRASLLTFTSVRNPYDSLVSLYVKKSNKYVAYLADHTSWVYRIPGYVEDMEFCRTHSFSEWLDKHYPVTWLDRLLKRGQRSLYGRYTNGVDKVMKFENLQNDFESVMRAAGVSGDVTIPRINETRARKSSSHQEYYSKAARRTVDYVFKPDLDAYGYSFDRLHSSDPIGNIEASKTELATNRHGHQS